MLAKIVCLALGIVVSIFAVIVYACCKVNSDLARKVERWSDDE